MPLERIADCSSSLRIPDSNAAVGGSGYDVAPIGRISNRIHPLCMPHNRFANYSTGLSIPNSNRIVIGSRDNTGPIRRVTHAPDGPSVSSPLQCRCWAGTQPPHPCLDGPTKFFAEHPRYGVPVGQEWAG